MLCFKQKYRQSLVIRFFRFKKEIFKTKGIWFHACSLGEVSSLSFVLNLIKNKDVYISTTTNTGFNKAKEFNVKGVSYLPFDLFAPFWVRPQKVLFILEAEFWYLTIIFAKLRGAKIIYLNARISDKSYKSYLRFKFFYKRLFAYVDIFYTQSELDKERFEVLGAKNIEVLGNIKLANEILVTKHLIKPASKIIFGASTHEGEEELIFNAFIKTRDKEKLLIAPRHPHRFLDVYKYLNIECKKHNLSFSKYSDNKDFKTDLVLIDLLGELINIYAISDIVILGGSFVPKGGHNVLEPATFNVKLISGEYMFNQKDLLKYVFNIKISSKDNLVQTLKTREYIENSYIKYDFNKEKLIKLIKDIA